MNTEINSLCELETFKWGLDRTDNVFEMSIRPKVSCWLAWAGALATGEDWKINSTLAGMDAVSTMRVAEEQRI